MTRESKILDLLLQLYHEYMQDPTDYDGIEISFRDWLSGYIEYIEYCGRKDN